MTSTNNTHGFSRTLRATIPAPVATIEAIEMAMVGFVIVLSAGHEGFDVNGTKIVRGSK